MESSCHLSHLLVGLSVCRSVCMESVLWQNDWVDPDAVWMVIGFGRGMVVLDGDGYRRRGRGSFGVEFGAYHCNQWGLCCVVVWKCMNRLSCCWGWWVRWAQALMGVHMTRGEGEVLKGFGELSRHWFEWRIFKQKCICLVCEKLTIFPYGQYVVGNVFSLAFWWYTQVQDWSWGLREVCKNITVISTSGCRHRPTCSDWHMHGVTILDRRCHSVILSQWQREKSKWSVRVSKWLYIISDQFIVQK